MTEQTSGATRRHNYIKTKEVIYKTMMKMLREDTYENLTVRNIAETAGISIGTFYHYFNGKDELLSYYLRKVFDIDTVREEVAADGDIKAELLRVYEIYLGYFKEAGVEYISNFYNSRNQYLNTRRRIGQADVIQDQAAALVMELLIAAQYNGYIPLDTDVEDTTNDLCVITKGVVMDWCLNQGNTDIIAYIRKMIGIYIDSLLTPAYHQRFSKRSSLLDGQER
ncbi:MAG: TetR/AcrR family transcriptional regulator [Firmicutes bacterium]|nr:TetR/AcrR family transcriptional regulator [Bacillota bacterium]